jgi:hypothetical protein
MRHPATQMGIGAGYRCAERLCRSGGRVIWKVLALRVWAGFRQHPGLCPFRARRAAIGAGPPAHIAATCALPGGQGWEVAEMSSFPCLVRFVSSSGQVRYRLGEAGGPVSGLCGGPVSAEHFAGGGL